MRKVAKVEVRKIPEKNKKGIWRMDRGVREFIDILVDLVNNYC